MTPQEWDEISEIFHSAVELAPEERKLFLDRVCGANRALRAEVESLLAADSEAADFIAQPALDSTQISAISADASSLSGAFIGHYRVEKSIGAGGMGEVYLATDTRLNRCVALKRLPFPYSSDPAFIKRFRKEAQVAATLNHPNVATVYAVEEFNGKPFIAMEYVEGQTLDALTPSGGLDLKIFLDWFIPLAEALRHAHERGVTHRDFKPGNIMISADGTPKILDFGLAQVTTESQGNGAAITANTQRGHVAGTPAYMSPEQAQGQNIDHRTDIFSFGVVMYEALTGRRPFAGDSHAEVISNLLKSEPAPVSSLRPGVPRLLTRLITRCLAKRRRDRFQSMQEVRTILAETRAILDLASSGGSFGRRLYLETAESSKIWLVAAAAATLVLAAAGWFYFSDQGDALPISFTKMTMRRLSDTNNVGYAQIAPDGRAIAFATFEEDGTRALWIRRVDDRNALQIVPPQRLQYWGGLAISEDGGQVFYITAGRTATHGTLYRVSSLGGPPRKLIEVANDVGGISPDGQRILFVRYGEPNSILSANTSDGGDERVIRSAPADGAIQTNFRDPHFSPDGRAVYYISYETIGGVEHWSLEMIPVGGGTARQILRQGERISELAVLKNSNSLLITSVDPVSNLQQLFHVSLPSGRKTRVTNDLFFYFGVSVDREGRNIVVSQRSNEQRVWVGEASDLESLKQLNQEPNAFRSVDWTPDGRIVYDGLENNLAHIWIADADGKNLQRLTDSGSDDSEPRVSGDGRYIVFTSKRSGRNQVWRMEIDGSGQTLLADVSGVTQAPRFASDGQTVVFQWFRDRDRLLGSVPLAGGAVSVLPQVGGEPFYNSNHWAMSPDGRQVAYTVWDEAERRIKVAVRSVDSDHPTTILNIWPSLIFKWMPDGRSIYYRERQFGYQPENEVLKVDIANGRSSVLVSAGQEYIVDLTFSRDGKKAALVRGRNTSNVVMLTPAPE